MSFDLEKYIPTVVLVQVKLPPLPLHCCFDDVLAAIGNSLGQYIDKLETKSPLFSYARICVEVDLDIKDCQKL